MSLIKTLYEKDLYPEIEDSAESDFARDCIQIASERLAKGEIDRRTFMKAIAFLGAAPAVMTLGGKTAQAAEEVVVVNWGGPAVEAYTQAFGVPFEKATGVKVVIDGTGPLGSKIKAMVDANAVTWDVCDTGTGTTLVLEKQGVLQKIDYGIVDKSKMQEKFAYEYGCANYMFSFILAYNKTKVPSAPTGWADFWDLEKFPGYRTLRKQPNGMLEACMMAAGKDKDSIYPIDLDLAIGKLKEIKDYVIAWGSGSQSQELFRTGEVIMGDIWHTRANLLNQETNGDVTWTWEQGIVTAGMWNVPNNNPAGTKTAMEFIASAQDPEQQLVLFNAMGNGPANPAAAAQVPDDKKYIDPGQPENLAKQVLQNGPWYQEDSGVRNLTNDELSREMWLDALSS
ncbi:MAG: ABC transporter substrate-binding protein [Alphaproteobacteria bacterium]|nr:ABC transporter substrate-binding protein [Alphaproteobacteria bacterium]